MTVGGSAGRCRALSVGFAALALLVVDGSGRAQAAPPPPDKAPTLRLPAVAGGGAKVSTGPTSKPQVLLYVRGDSARARPALEQLVRLHAEWGKRVRFLAITSTHGKSVKRVRGMARELGVRFPVCADVDSSYWAQAGLMVFQTVLVVDAKGRVALKVPAFLSDQAPQVDAALRKLLGLPAKVVPKPAVQAPITSDDRWARFRQARQRAERKRAEQLLLASNGCLSESTVALTLTLYERWAALLPLPTDACLETAAPLIRKRTPLSPAMLAALEPCAGVRAPLWYGRALRHAGRMDAAARAFAGCVGKPALRGQCEFELAALAVTKQPGQALQMCVAGLRLLKASASDRSRKPTPASGRTGSPR